MKPEFAGSPEVVERVFKPIGKDQALLDTLVNRKQNFVIRKTKYYTSIIHDGLETIYPSKDKECTFPPKQLWIFSAVKRDAIRFTQENPNFEISNKLPVNVTNIDYDNSYGQITGTDIESAYWTMAYKMGIISEQTYTKGNEKDYKVTKLASLAVLGRIKAYYVYDKGVKIEKPIIVATEHHEKLKNLYRAIRYGCYYHMGQLAVLLGKDFEAYRTDCIYYRDSVENRKKVYDYLTEQGFTYRQIIWEEENQ
jgi:hypothetical protein